MHRLLLTAATVTATVTLALAQPATAQSFASAGFTSAPAFASTGSGGTTEGIRNATASMTGVTVHRGGADRGDGLGHQRRGRSDGFGVYVAPRDGYDLNQGWASNSYNDWWHDRPDRAFPRWITSNQNCERQWWSGGGWRC